MTNPLDEIWNAYQTTLAAYKVVHRCVENERINQNLPFQNTRFANLPDEQCLALITTAREELDDLTVLSFAAAFERKLRDEILAAGGCLAESGPGNFGAEVQRHFAETAEYWRMADVFELFAERLGPSDKPAYSQIRKYRDWVAHGRNPGGRPQQATPQFTYERLTTILVRLGYAASPS